MLPSITSAAYFAESLAEGAGIGATCMAVVVEHALTVSAMNASASQRNAAPSPPGPIRPEVIVRAKPEPRIARRLSIRRPAKAHCYRSGMAQSIGNRSRHRHICAQDAAAAACTQHLCKLCRKGIGWAMLSLQFSARDISVCVDLSVGHIADMIVQSGARTLRPLHRAPWLSEPAATLPEGIAPGLARLSGDFLCAPFSLNDVEPAPAHGWTGNSAWDVIANGPMAGGWQATLRLRHDVLGATVTKRLTLRDDHPFLYQEHEIAGGSGGLPVAHHVMSRMLGDGQLSFSPKRVALTPPASLEPDPSRGAYLLAYPGRSEDLAAFPDRHGGVSDLTRYRAGDRREDFVVLVEADHAGPGWTTLAREAENDLVLVLKDPRDLPVTMLWLSNGGRNYAPWNGRHLGVLGIEDGRTAVGHASSTGENFVSREGVSTSFALGPEGSVRFRHVSGVVPMQGPAEPASRVSVQPGRLVIEFARAATMHVPFDDMFLA